MGDDYALRECFKEYLVHVCNCTEKSAKSYSVTSINTASRYLRNMNKISSTLYEVQEPNAIEGLRDLLYKNKDFMGLDKRGDNMYTVGVNHYIRFVRGKGFEQLGKGISVMDKPIQVPRVTVDQGNRWRRSGIIKQQSLIAAGYLCEIDNKHTTFIANNADHAYMEGHHLIPMKWQGNFNTSLDVYANIVCLCPTCHRLLHFGRDCDKIPVLDKLYCERSERLANSGIKLSRDEFMELSLRGISE